MSKIKRRYSIRSVNSPVAAILLSFVLGGIGIYKLFLSSPYLLIISPFPLQIISS
jgi:hypothetical protein